MKTELICQNCNETFYSNRQDKKTCSNACRKALSRQTQEDKIKTNAVFAWEAAIALAEHCKRDVGWIQRGLEACDGVGISREYFVNRYLNYQDIPLNPDVNAESMIVQKRWLQEGRL